MGLFVLFIYGFAREGNANAIPGTCLIQFNSLPFLLTHVLNVEPRMIGTYLALTIAITAIIWLIGYMLLRATEGAFVNYVSQNVGYTSRVIFKKVNKVKLELAMSLILLLYIPVLYTFTQTLIHVQDWSDSHAASFRQNYNYYTPCYIRCSLTYSRKHLYLLSLTHSVHFHRIMSKIFQLTRVRNTTRICLHMHLMRCIGIIR